MNTGQTMLTILALALLSVITMRYYSTMGMAGRNLSNSNASFTATTVATSILEQIQNCAFDAYTDTATTGKDSTRFAKPDHFGIEAGETKGDWRNYDDVDDFIGDTIEYKHEVLGEIYKAIVDVYYVNPYGDIDVKINGATDQPRYVKRIDVLVWRSYPPVDTVDAMFNIIKVSNLHGYFFYNPI